MKYIDMVDFVKFNPLTKFEPNEKTKYELVGIISSQKKNIKESEYFTLIKKSLIGEKHKKWIVYNRNTEIFINEKVALNEFPP